MHRIQVVDITLHKLGCQGRFMLLHELGWSQGLNVKKRVRLRVSREATIGCKWLVTKDL